MSSARDMEPSRPPQASSPSGSSRPAEIAGVREDPAAALTRLVSEMYRAAESGAPANSGRNPLLPGRSRRRERHELQALRQAALRWAAALERLRQEHEQQEERTPPAGISGRGEREARLERDLAERDADRAAEIGALREAAANRELDLQREHGAEARRLREEIASLKKRLQEAESDSGGTRDEELRQVKRHAYERERELQRGHAERLSEVEREAEHRVSALQAQREADNRSLIDRHAADRARREQELESLRLRRLSEARAYGGRIEELARERAGERTSLEEAVAKLREKHEAERSRLQERVESLEEALQEQESITVGLLGELGYSRRPAGLAAPQKAPGSGGELEVANSGISMNGGGEIDRALRELRGIAASGNLLREALALFNATEHAKVVEAISKSLGEPEVYAALESHGEDGPTRTPGITLVWPGLGWRRYVSEPRSTAEPQVYLAGQGEADPAVPLSAPNARLDGRGLLSLGVRPL